MPREPWFADLPTVGEDLVDSGKSTEASVVKVWSLRLVRLRSLGIYLTRRRRATLTVRGATFVAVPRTLQALPEQGVVEERHADGVVRATTLERTLIDLLHAPRLGGGWEEVWRSLEMVPFFDLDAVAAHALALGSALTTARVGFFLEQHRLDLMAEDRHLAPLRAHSPRQPRYFDARRTSGTLVPGWNLIVPDNVLGRTWAEVS
jgi:predicted transcriptional regulator of viral defense system